MSDPLDDRLRALGSAPLAPVPPASAVIRRGDRRRRRTRALSATAVVVALLVGGVAVRDLTASGDDDALQYAPPPTTSTSPSPSPTPAAGETAAGAPVTGLLQPTDARAASGGTWQATSAESQPWAQLQVCATADVGGRVGAHRLLSRGDDVVSSQVIDFGEGSAPGVLASLRSDVERCPRRTEDSEDGKATVSFALEQATDEADVLVRLTSRTCDTCPAVVRLVTAIAMPDGDDSLVGYVTVPESERPRLAAWGNAQRDRLRCVSLGCPAGEAPSGSPGAGLGAEDPLRFDGIGAVRIGMTVAEAERAAGQRFTTFKDDLGNDCGFVSPRSGQPELTFMVVRDRITLVYIDGGSDVGTDREIGLGATEAQVRAAYDGVVTTKHSYTDGSYLTATSPDRRHAIVFETDGQRVTLIRGGDASASGYVEGCA